MCEQCWKDAGSPRMNNSKVRAAAELISAVYEHHDCGGGLHIILDDWNVENGHLEFCKGHLEDPKYQGNPHDNVTTERLNAERSCLRALTHLTKDERLSALAIYYGFNPCCTSTP